MSASSDDTPDDRRTGTPDGADAPGSHDPGSSGGADRATMTTAGSGVSHDASLRDGRRLKSAEEGYWAEHVGKQERHALLATAVNASNTMVVLADVTRDDQPLIYVNRYFCEFTGYDPEEILGRNCRFLQFRNGERVEQGADEPRAEIRGALENREFVRTILRNFKKDGTEFRNELFMSPVEDGAGRVKYFAGVQNDTSVRDKLVDDLAASEAALRGVFEASPVALGLVTRRETGRATHLRMNPAAAELLGADAGGCGGKTFREVGGPAGLGARLERAFDRVDGTGEPVRFRFDATVDGEPRALAVAVTAVEPPETAPGTVPTAESRDARRYCYAVEDLTAFNEVERDRALMRAAVERADAATCVLSADLDPPGPRFLYTNPAATKLTGYGPATLLDELITELDGRQTDPAFPARFRRALKERGAFRGDSVVRCAGGGQKTIEWNVSAVRDDAGAVTHFVATLTDVAERREMERQVLEAQTREQARIARDLHDGVAQQLAGLSMLCGSLTQRGRRRGGRRRGGRPDPRDRRGGRPGTPRRRPRPDAAGTHPRRLGEGPEPARRADHRDGLRRMRRGVPRRRPAGRRPGGRPPPLPHRPGGRRQRGPARGGRPCGLAAGEGGGRPGGPDDHRRRPRHARPARRRRPRRPRRARRRHGPDGDAVPRAIGGRRTAVRAARGRRHPRRLRVPPRPRRLTRTPGAGGGDRRRSRNGSWRVVG